MNDYKPYIDKLKSSGLRPTKQRLAICKILFNRSETFHFSIENLKIFKDEQELKIAPITLLYGENSSGKTSLLKTFDIVHNIFSEQQVKRGKTVGQKDSPFYRNENIQNISSKNIF